ncbi:sugar kinase [Oscillospiraceae bacterium MB08-C2-2]|nr:sugar kinase [Oscillospiraceae bacterium MB08-C2-2]
MKTLDVVSFGVTVADLLVKGVPDTLLQEDVSRAEDMILSVGGDALNQASTLAQLGHSVTLVARLGKDIIGQHIINTCVERGITPGFAVKEGLISPISIVLIKPDGDRYFLGRKLDKLNARVCFEDIDLELIKQARAVTQGSMFTSMDLVGENLKTVFKTAKDSGAFTISDFLNKPGVSLEDVRVAMPYIDYLLPSLEEGTFYTGETDPARIADIFLNMGVGTVGVKQGGDGVYLKNADLEVTVPSYKVPVVDTTGAGDNFVAGFISGLLDGEDLLSCARRGSACGAINVGEVGASGAVKSKQQVLDFMTAHA